ncbi:MAG: nicotinate-nucleotide adenylyltransferase [Desulfobacterales bacterium]
MKKLGLFGGTFNPIHLGHLTVAEEVREGFDLDQICFIPAAMPPHKQKKKVAEASDRLEMIRIAIADYEAFSVSDIELKRSGPSYTIDTLDYFKTIFFEETQLYFIVGMDAFLDIETWKSFRQLFNATPFIVMSRPGALDEELEKKVTVLKKILVSKVSPDYRFDSARYAFFHREKMPVFLFDVTPVNISATMIREKISQGKSITSLVPKKVKEYIESKGLYL